MKNINDNHALRKNWVPEFIDIYHFFQNIPAVATIFINELMIEHDLMINNKLFIEQQQKIDR